MESWSSNLLFGDANFNEISNALDSAPPSQRNNRRGNSQRDPLPMGLSFLNGGESLQRLLDQDTNPSSVDTSSTGENPLFNIPPMPNFDQLGLENVLDKFLPIDGSVRLPPPSNDPIVHSRDNVPIPSIGQLGLDSSGLFGQSMFSPNAGSLSGRASQPSRLTDATPSFRNDNTNNRNTNNNHNNFQTNNQMNSALFPTEASPTIPTSPAQPPTMAPGRSEQQKLLDQQIWDSIIPPLPENRNPVEVFPQNEPTPKPKKTKKVKSLLPLLPPSPSRKTSSQSQSTKNKDELVRITSDNILNNVPSIDQLTFGSENRPSATTRSPSKINSENLIENIPSIDELGMDIFGNSLPFINQGKAQKQDVKPTPTAGDMFQFPDQFSGSNRHINSMNKEETKQSVESSTSKMTDSDNNTSSLENLWNILLAEVPGLPGIISGEDATTPKPKTLDIEAILGISASDIDAFNANQDNSFLSQDSKPQIPAPKVTTNSPPKFRSTTPFPKTVIPQTTLPPVIYIQTTTPTPPPPVTVYIPPPSTKPPTTPKPAVYNLPDLPMPEIFLPSFESQQPTESSVPPFPTLSSLEKTTSHITIDFSKNDPNTKKTSDSSKKLPLPFEKLLPDFSSLDTKSEKTHSAKTKSKSNINSMLLPSYPDTPITTPFPFHLVPTIPEKEFKKPKSEDLGIFNTNHEPDPFINFLPQEPKSDHNVWEERPGGNEQTSKRQSEVFSLDSLMGNKQTTFFDNFNEPKHENNIDLMSNGFKNLNSNSDFVKNTDVDSNSPYKPLTTIKPTTKEELFLPGLDLLLGTKEENTIEETTTTTTTMAPSTTVPEIPMLDLSLLGGFNRDITNHEQPGHITKDEEIKVTINSNDIKDVPPLDFDIFKNMNKDIKTDFTTPLPIPTLPALPSLGNINTVNNDGHETFGSNTFEMKNNVDPLKQIIDSGPSHSHTPGNSIPISKSLIQNSDLFPFVAPTSEASKHFVFQDQSNGGNIRTHPPPGSITTTPKPINQNDTPRKPNIIVIDIQKTLPERTVTQTKPNSLNGLQNTDNIASIESVSNSQNIVTLHQGSRTQQVTQTPPKVTTPAWLAPTILAIRDRLNQLRAMRNNAQNNANNNIQNPVLPNAQNSNPRQNSNVPSVLPANSQRHNLQQLQILLRNRMLQNSNVQNSNLQNSNSQPQRGTAFTPRMNINFRGVPQNQAPQQQANFQQIGRPQFQLPNIPNQLNQGNSQQIRQPAANFPSSNLLQTQSNGIHGSQTQQTETTQNDLALVRERIRQRIQQVLRTQILRHLLARRLQTLRNNQTPNNAQPTQNQPIWRAPSSTNGMNVMNANNAINLIRQARQRTLTATQQQRQQQPQQNQPVVDLSRNIFERFQNTNFQNPPFVPIQFRPQQPANNQQIDLSRLFQNNGGANFNNRFAQPFQQITSNRTNGNRINTDQGMDLSLPPSELALRNLRNFNLQRAQRVQQGTDSTFRPNQNLVVQRTAIPVSEAFQQIERLRAQNRDIAPFGNFNSNNIPQFLMERFRNGLPRFQPVQNVPHTVFNRQRILVPINGPIVGLRHNQNITRRPNVGQTSAPPRFTGPPGSWPWVAQQNSDK